MKYPDGWPKELRIQKFQRPGRQHRGLMGEAGEYIVVEGDKQVADIHEGGYGWECFSETYGSNTGRDGKATMLEALEVFLSRYERKKERAPHASTGQETRSPATAAEYSVKTTAIPYIIRGRGKKRSLHGESLEVEITRNGEAIALVYGNLRTAKRIGNLIARALNVAQTHPGADGGVP